MYGDYVGLSENTDRVSGAISYGGCLPPVFGIFGPEEDFQKDLVLCGVFVNPDVA